MKKIRLGDIATLITKGTTPTTIGFSFVDTGVNFVKIESISENGEFLSDKFAHITDECDNKLKRSQLEENDILFSIAGAIGRTAIVPRSILPANTNQALAIIRIPQNAINLRFVLYALQSQAVEEQSEKQKQGVAQLNLSLKNIADILIPLVSSEKQDEIVRNLAAVDTAIAIRKEQIRLIDQVVKSRFIELFGEADGFESVPLNDSVDEMFIGPFGSSLKNECFVVAEQGYCMVYEQKHAIKKTMDVDTRFVDEKKYKELRRFTVQGGDIIVSCRGTIGETFIVPEDAPLGIMHPSIMKIRLKTTVYNRVFFNHLLQTVLNRHEADANGSGVKMAITATALGKERFIRPPMALQEQFAAFVEQTDKSKYYSSLSFRYCQAAANTYRQEWMTCRTSDF